MKINFDTLSIQVSAGELSQLFISTNRGERSRQKSSWRTQVGQTRHREFAEEKAKKREVQSEISLKKIISHKGWSIEITGRIDLIEKQEENQWILWEVKTVSRPLPIPQEDLSFYYPHYFNQLAIYHALYNSCEPEPRSKARLAFISITNDTEQVLFLDPEEAEHRYQSILDQLVGYLQSRRDKQSHRKNLIFLPAFKEAREGQDYARKQLLKRPLQEKFLCFEAPTGFGKTGVSLDAGLTLLREGHFDRIIYLTGKNSGQEEVIKQLGKMIPSQNGNGLFYYQMQNQSNHFRPDHSLSEIPPEVSLALRKESLSFSEVQELARIHRLDGYFLSQLRLNHADLWVGDYNYIFSPKARSVFFDRFDFSADNTLLIIDEAHNLPERVRTAYSARITIEEIKDLRNQIDFFANRWCHILEEWINNLEKLSQRRLLGENDLLQWNDLTWETLDFAKAKHPPIEEFSDFQKEAWWNMLSFAEAVQSDKAGYLLWMPAPYTIEHACLDASDHIKKTLQEFKHSILMSATLQPFENFYKQLGCKELDQSPLEVPAFWRDHAYKVAIDTRVNTSLATRENNYEITAQTVSELANWNTDPVVVFFSSFKYAKAIHLYLESAFGHLTITRQEAGLNSTEQFQLLKEALLTSQVIFLVMGGSLAEGIDLLGGSVKTVMVVGPPLSEKNILQEEIARFSNREEVNSFEKTYAIPAMRRLHQALGRLVRSPGQTARVLLHDVRFSRAPFNDLLFPEYQSDTTIKTDQQLSEWLSSEA